MKLARQAGILACLLAAAPAWCQEEQTKQEPPDFTSGYHVPALLTPMPRADVFAIVDVAVLALALALTAYFTLTRRSRAGVRMVSLFSVAYFGFFRQGCICAVGSVQNVAMSIFQHGYALPITVAVFFLLPLAFALFFGRVFCAAVCPLGAIQDLVLLKARRVPEPLDHALGLLPYLYLGAAVLFSATGADFIICRWDPFVGFFRMAGHADIIAVGAALLLLSTFIGRPYCRFLCPYGVLLRWCSTLSRWKAEVTAFNCIKCHLCANSCPFGALRPPLEGGETQPMLRRRMGVLLAALPAVLVLAAWLGFQAGPAFAEAHPIVSLAHRVWAEEHGLAHGVTVESAGFYSLGGSRGNLFAEAASIERRFHIGAALFAAFATLVIWAKMMSLARPIERKTYQADPGSCVACARCFSSCPVKKELP